jgi:hypothetical protein
LTVLSVLRGWPALGFARSRGLARTAGICTAGVLVAAGTPDQPVEVPLRAAAIGLAPLVAAAPGVFLGACLERPGRDLEPTGRARLACARALWLSVVLGAMSAPGLVGLGLSSDSVQLVARNLGLTGGLGLLAVAVLPPLATWLPGAVLVATTLLYGSVSMSGQSRQFAYLIFPVGSRTANLVALAVFAVGAVRYVAKDARPSE